MKIKKKSFIMSFKKKLWTMDCACLPARQGLWTKQGFTLIEVMVATAVLSLGLVLIYQAFFISLHAFDYYLNYLNAQLWIDEKIWQLEDSFRREAFFNPVEMSGDFTLAGKIFNWTMNCAQIVPEELYKVSMKLAWQQGSRSINLLRVAHISNFSSE